MDAIEALLSRQSIRQFKDQEIPEEILGKLFEATMRAPSGGNLQNYSLIVTKDPLRRKLLADIHFSQTSVLQAPVIVTFCADVSRNSRWCTLRDAEPGFENFWGFLLGMADAWSAAENFIIAAQSLGLGSCHSGATFIKALNLIDFFSCPQGVIPVATIALGYAKEKPIRRPRLPLDAIIHTETYSPLSHEALLDFYQDKEKDDFLYYRTLLQLKESSKNSPDNLAKIYTKLKYPKSDTTLFGKNFVAALKKQNFL